jgi:thiamine-monophosphate kinase
VRIDIDLDAVPVAPGVAEVAAQLGVPAWELAAAGGEDFELCACVARGTGASDPAGLTRVGTVSAEGSGVVLSSGGTPRRLAGYEHPVG